CEPCYAADIPLAQPALVSLAQRAGRDLGGAPVVGAYTDARWTHRTGAPDLPVLRSAVSSVTPTLLLPLWSSADGSAPGHLDRLPDERSAVVAPLSRHAGARLEGGLVRSHGGAVHANLSRRPAVRSE